MSLSRTKLSGTCRSPTQRPGNSPEWSGTYHIEGVDNADRDLRVTLYESTPSGAVALGLFILLPHDSVTDHHTLHMGFQNGLQFLLAVEEKSQRLSSNEIFPDAFGFHHAKFLTLPCHLH